MAEQESGRGATRRRFLTGAAGVAGGATIASLLPPSLQAALAEPPPDLAGGLDGVEHVVFLMQENRSFDHYFGTLRGVRGFGDRSAIELPDGRSVFQQPATEVAEDAFHTPFAARGADTAMPVLGNGTDPQNIGMLPHSWNDQQDALNGGWNNNWILAKNLLDMPAMIYPWTKYLTKLIRQAGFSTTMSYLDRTDLPFHHALADTFTVCDAYHSSILGGTIPNRLFHYSGSLGREPDGTLSVHNNASRPPEGIAHHPGYAHRTYAERLTRAGVSWKVYQEYDNFGDNALEYFAPFVKVARKVLAGVDDTEFDNFEHFHATINAYWQDASRASALEQVEANLARLTPAERDLYDRALRRVPTDGLVEDFREDVKAGKLPRVSWIAAPTRDCEHPGGGTPVRAAYMIYRLLEALTEDPAVWAKTAVFLTYDENDGLFDHVPPPQPPAGDPVEYYEDKPVGLGFRVPMVVISPWTVGGHTCSEVFDHTSTLRFLEKWLDVEEPNISDWRRTVCGDLTSAFDFTKPGSFKPLTPQDPPPPAPAILKRWWPWQREDRTLPTQEEGQRGLRPLPYRPEASARLMDDGARLAITLTDTGDRGSHFAAYPYEGEFAKPLHFDVSGRRVVTVPMDKDRYRVSVTGPNRFRRDFAGAVDGKAAGVQVSSAAGEDGTLTVSIVNPGPGPLAFTVAAEGYSTGTRQVTVGKNARQVVPWPAGEADGWYDLTVTAAEDPSFRRRLMGHVENGRPSRTPPSA